MDSDELSSFCEGSLFGQSVLAKKKRKRNLNKTNFTAEEKKKLAMLLRQHPSIWSLEDSSHKNLDAINSDWRKIAICMDKTVDDCKANWKSLRDSHRYHNASRKLTKSGSAASEDPQDEESHVVEDSVDWEFSACLDFLKPASSKRRTFTNDLSERGSEVGEEDSPQTPALTPTPRSSYEYSTLRQPKKDVMDENITALTQTVSTLIKMRTEACNEPVQPPLFHYSLLSNLDRVLKKLPEDIVEELGISFQQQAVAALRSHNARGPGN